MDTVVFVDAQAVEYFTNEALLAKVDGEKDSVTARAYHVSGYPTSVLLDADGEEIDRIIGYAPTEEFLGYVKDFRQGNGTLADLLSKAEDSTDRALFFEIADKYKFRGGAKEATDWFHKVIVSGQPLDSMSGEARLALADMHYRAKEYDKAMSGYVTVKKDFGPNQFGESADIWCAVIHRKKGDTTKAISAFEKFIKDYPESENVEYAQEQIAKLNGTEEEK